MSRRRTSFGQSDGSDSLRVDERDREAFLDYMDAEERLVPAQWRAPVTIDDPCRKLAMAVLTQAIADMFAKNNDDARHDARAWLRSDSTANLYDFVSLADLLGFDPECVRAKLRARIEAGERVKVPRPTELYPAAKTPKPRQKAA